MTADQGARRPWRVLIAQQGTITPYRVPLFEGLARTKPQDWEFTVVCDTPDSGPGEYYRGQASGGYGFPTLPARTRRWKIGPFSLTWQHFWWRARHYDLVITDNYIKILTYPALYFWKLTGQRRVLWGIPRDAQAENPKGLKRLAEWVKRRLLHGADGFFAYTEGSAQELREMGFPAEGITVLNNTIDIDSERRFREGLVGRREELRAKWGLENDRIVLTSIGRLTRDKRADLFGPMAQALHALDPRIVLLVAGGGPLRSAVEQAAAQLGPDVLRHLGTLDRPGEAQEILSLSDVYYMPGYVGLAPLQAACHDLPTVAHHLGTHSPEVEYLTPENSRFLTDRDRPEVMAAELIAELPRMLTPDFRAGIWPSIRHLTMESMIQRYSEGISRVLGGTSSRGLGPKA